MKRILQLVAIALLTIIFLALFLWKSNLRDVWRIMLSTNLAWFAVGFVVNGATLIFRTIRWRLLLHESDPPRFYPTFFANTMGYMLSTILPIRAGDVARPALLARRTSVRFSEALGTVLTERVLDLLCILALFVLFGVYRWRDFDSAVVHGGTWFSGIILGTLTVLLVAFYFSRGAVRRLHEALGRLLPTRFRPSWMRFFDAFARTLDIVERPAAFGGVLITTALIWFCLTSQFWFVLMAAHRPLPLDSTIFLSAATTVGIAIPTPGGVGGFHKVSQYVLTNFYGFDIDTSVAVSVLFHIVGTMPVVVVGAILFLREGLNWRELSKETHVEET